MSETDLETRLAAVERALTDGETDLADLQERTDLAATVEELDARVAELEATVEELDAALQAVRGYAGNVRAVNRDVERRASAALAKAEAIESSLGDAGDRDRTARDADCARTARDTDRDRNADRIADADRDRDADDARGAGHNTRDTGERRDDHAAATERAAGHRRDAPEYGESDEGEDGGTEQFIQRVREAL
mgnify:CR=1 FL=1